LSRQKLIILWCFNATIPGALPKGSTFGGGQFSNAQSRIVPGPRSANAGGTQNPGGVNDGVAPSGGYATQTPATGNFATRSPSVLAKSAQYLEWDDVPQNVLMEMLEGKQQYYIQRNGPVGFNLLTRPIDIGLSGLPAEDKEGWDKIPNQQAYAQEKISTRKQQGQWVQPATSNALGSAVNAGKQLQRDVTTAEAPQTEQTLQQLKAINNSLQGLNTSLGRLNTSYDGYIDALQNAKQDYAQISVDLSDLEAQINVLRKNQPINSQAFNTIIQQHEAQLKDYRQQLAKAQKIYSLSQKAFHEREAAFQQAEVDFNLRMKNSKNKPAKANLIRPTEAQKSHSGPADSSFYPLPKDAPVPSFVTIIPNEGEPEAGPAKKQKKGAGGGMDPSRLTPAPPKDANKTGDQNTAPTTPPKDPGASRIGQKPERATDVPIEAPARPTTPHIDLTPNETIGVNLDKAKTTTPGVPKNDGITHLKPNETPHLNPEKPNVATVRPMNNASDNPSIDGEIPIDNSSQPKRRPGQSVMTDKQCQDALKNLEQRLQVDNLQQSLVDDLQSLPPLKTGWLRCVHITAPENVERIITNGLDFSTQGMISSTAQAFSSQRDFIAQPLIGDRRFSASAQKMVIFDVPEAVFKFLNNPITTTGKIDKKYLVGVIANNNNVENRTSNSTQQSADKYTEVPAHPTTPHIDLTPNEQIGVNTDAKTTLPGVPKNDGITYPKPNETPSLNTDKPKTATVKPGNNAASQNNYPDIDWTDPSSEAPKLLQEMQTHPFQVTEVNTSNDAEKVTIRGYINERPVDLVTDKSALNANNAHSAKKPIKITLKPGKSGPGVSRYDNFKLDQNKGLVQFTDGMTEDISHSRDEKKLEELLTLTTRILHSANNFIGAGLQKQHGFEQEPVIFPVSPTINELDLATPSAQQEFQQVLNLATTNVETRTIFLTNQLEAFQPRDYFNVGDKTTFRGTLPGGATIQVEQFEQEGTTGKRDRPGYYTLVKMGGEQFEFFSPRNIAESPELKYSPSIEYDLPENIKIQDSSVIQKFAAILLQYYDKTTQKFGVKKYTKNFADYDENQLRRLIKNGQFQNNIRNFARKGRK
jgi:D-ribose pyranose/furanose isomerase RbsD